MNRTLPTLSERLNNPDVSQMERSQRGVFHKILAELKLPKPAHALSVSVGDGIWDYLAFESNPSITSMTATDIVSNPVKEVALLQKKGTWDFVQVEAEKKLPFKDGLFDVIFHHDVVEHVKKPYLFLQEQYRVLKPGGHIVFGTPNLHRPANIIKLLLGKLYFPFNIGNYEEIGDYIHIQEFYKEQMIVMLEELGFKNVTAHYCYFGLYFLKLTFSLYPSSSIGKSLCQYLIFSAEK